MAARDAFGARWALREYLGYRARARLSQAALETLAVIAYRQPITMPEISFLRGVNSAAVVRTLVERKLVVVAGKEQVVGTPLLYRTSKEFLVHFGLSDLSALPTPEEVAQVAGEGVSGLEAPKTDRAGWRGFAPGGGRLHSRGPREGERAARRVG